MCEMTKRLSVDFEDDVYKEFSKKCIEVDETKSDVVRGLVNDWLNESEE
jgi:macrodomain Ter protein organizer (MatP/YcbG family)